MNKKRSARLRRATRTREHIKRLGFEKGIARLCINRSTSHIYAQVFAPTGGKVLASASSLEKEVRDNVSESDTKTHCAKRVGELIAIRAKQAGVNAVASERSGFKYHGRLAALIESAREHGLVV